MSYRSEKPNDDDDDDVADIQVEVRWFFFIIYDNSRNFVENMTIFKKLLYLNMTISV